MDVECNPIKFTYELRNLPQTDEFVYNTRGQRLHVRSSWPAIKAKAVIIFLHGYAAHISRPQHESISKVMNENGYAYIGLDFHGHGYSEGIKAYYSDFTHLEDDVLSLLFHLYRKKDGDNSKFDGDVCNLRRRAYGLPFYLMGSSQGGAVALRLGNRLHNTPTFAFSVYFRGCILLSPFIKANTPSTFKRILLENTMVQLFPKGFVTSAQSRDAVNSVTFSDPDYIAYIKSDEYPTNPDGLTYADPIRYKTAAETINMVLNMPNTIKQVSFPFVVFHDDKDVISLVDGIKDLMRLAKTSQNHKVYKQVNDGMHDVIVNKMEDVLPDIIQWLNTETA
jgi:alpha-beta hydrolase superfamily lysophospholipase